MTTQKEKSSPSQRHEHSSFSQNVDFSRECIPPSSTDTHARSIETVAQSDTGVRFSSQNKKQKLDDTVAVSQRQRELNNVSALRYRKKKKEKADGLDLRLEQLGAENTRLKNQVTAFTNEIDKMNHLFKSHNRTSSHTHSND